MKLLTLNFRLALQQVGILGPKQRDRTSNDYEGTEDRLVVKGLVVIIDDLLCLDKVGNIPFMVDASTQIAHSRKMARTSPDQNN